MKNPIKFIFFAVSTLWISACAEPNASQNHPIVAAYSESWNEKDIQEMAALIYHQALCGVGA